MKRTYFRSLLAVACTALLASSCYKEGSDDGVGAIYGQWLLDTQTVTFETSVGGNGSTNRTVVDFTDTGCYLELGLEGASAHLGVDYAVTIFSYNPDSKRIDFPRGLSVSGGGKVFALTGSYDVTELTDRKLVLSQKDYGISIGSIVEANQTATYEFHKTEVLNGKEQKQY